MSGRPEFDFLDDTEDFFDDGDNQLIRAEVGEDLEAYGLREATQEEIDLAMHSRDNHVNQKADIDDYDFRMEKSQPSNSAATVPSGPPRKWNGVSQNTGPKGVKKDYEEAKKATKINREMEDIRRERLIKQHVSGKKVYYLDENGKVQGFTQTVDEDGKVIGDAMIPASKLGFSSSKVDCDDEDYLRLRKTRESMLYQFLESVKDHQAEVTGEYRRAESIEHLSAMLKVNHPQCYAVLHLYDNENRLCQRLHMMFEDFAKMFDHVLFIRARSEDVMPNFDKRFLPTFIIYKDTKIVEKLIGVVGELGMSPSDDQLVQLLCKHDALSFPTNGYDKPGEAERRKHFLAHMSHEDSDDDWLDAE